MLTGIYFYYWNFKVNAVPTVKSLKLACWNAFNGTNDTSLPEDIDVFIVDNTKKKSICMIRNDSERAGNGIIHWCYLESKSLSWLGFRSKFMFAI